MSAVQAMFAALLGISALWMLAGALVSHGEANKGSPAQGLELRWIAFVIALGFLSLVLK